MAWEQLSINRPHLVYIILGGFTSLFMLCSSVIKERLYIGEATVATLCGIIFGPHAANLINPGDWGNTDQITLEFSRIVLVVQCFAVGVELPKAYMERHWRSVTFLLVPVMTFGWLITSLFIWAMFHGNLNWLESLTVAACVTATDPVLASSVVGKGKFAKRVPKHLRDLLSAESGCNDGMAFPFIYLALYILNYKPHVGEVFYHWICITILYECVFGCIYGVLIGYTARRLIRYAHEHDIIDRESFLVFYFVLALFCAGSGSLLGMDDLLVGFACGVGFSNDGWFTEKTEESHVSNVIDLLINLAFFVYFGTIIPWEQYNAGVFGLDVWKLVVIGILVLLFRRIPIMLMLKPFIPDIKTWREALFAGHFGPIGVGAIFVAILARAELETGETTPLEDLPDPTTTREYNVIYLIWPITTFLVICSIVVHGSSIAVFTLGKHINTLTLTMSYTQANEQGPSWMDRLPRIQSRSRSSMSMQSMDEKSPMGRDALPLGAPGTFLRRQKEEDTPGWTHSRQSSRHRSRHSRGRSRDIKRGPGGPISASAITPTSRSRRASPENGKESRSDSETLAMKSDPPSDEKTLEGEDKTDREKVNSAGEIYEEGSHTVYEDEEGNVLAVERTQSHGARREEDERKEGERLMHLEGADHNHGVAPTKDDPSHDTADEVRDEVKHLESEIAGKGTSKATPERPGRGWREGLNKMSTMAGSTMAGMRRREGADKPKPNAEKKEARGPARAYQYGNTIIVEDEDGEVIKKYDIPAPDKKAAAAADSEKAQKRVGQMSKMLGVGRHREGKAEASTAAGGATGASADKQGADGNADDDDHRVRFLMQGGRRMSKAEFIDHIRTMDPRSRVEAVEDSNAPEAVKNEARKEAREQAIAAKSSGAGRPRGQSLQVSQVPEGQPKGDQPQTMAAVEPVATNDSSDDLRLVDSNRREVPFHNIGDEIRRHRRVGEEGETAAERRRRLALQREDEDSDDDGTDRVPPRAPSSHQQQQHQQQRQTPTDDSTETAAERRRREGALGILSTQPSETLGETAAERRRREGALGISAQDSDSEEDEALHQTTAMATQRQSIRFADQAQQQQGGRTPRQSTLRWGKNVGR